MSAPGWPQCIRASGRCSVWKYSALGASDDRMPSEKLALTAGLAASSNTAAYISFCKSLGREPRSATELPTAQYETSQLEKIHIPTNVQGKPQERSHGPGVLDTAECSLIASVSCPAAVKTAAHGRQRCLWQRCARASGEAPHRHTTWQVRSIVM